MRSASDDNGEILFQEKHWLTPNQIKNMFSTMAKKAKQPGGKRTFSQTDMAQEDRDQTLDEESDSDDNEEMRMKLMK